MRIDAHHHVWDVDVHKRPWLERPGMAALRRSFTLDDLEPLARAAGVDHTVVVQTAADTAETRNLLSLAAAAPTVAGVVGWVDLTRPDVADRIATLRSGPGGARLVGLRHGVQAEGDPRWLCRSDVRRGLSAVAAAGLAYDLLVAPHQLRAAIDTADAVPSLTLVLDHLGRPPRATGEFAAWATELRAFAARPNTAAKLSGLDIENHDHLRACVDVALQAFGPDRLLFGSDWPVCLLTASYSQVVDVAERFLATLSAPERAAVFGGTAIRAYGLTLHRFPVGRKASR